MFRQITTIIYPFLIIVWPSLMKAAPSRWLAFGDIRGHIESCGCDPLTDLGGLNRLEHFLHLEGKVNQPFLLFNLGNNLTTSATPNWRDRFIMEFIASLQPTASLVNILELRRAEFLQGGKGFSKISKNYLLSNKKDGQLSWVQSVIVQQRAVIIGYVNDATVSDYLRPFDKKMANRWRILLKKHSTRDSYLLFSGRVAELQKIAKEVNFTTIIVANTNDFSVPITQREKEQPQRLQLSVNQRIVFMTPLAGQGVLRGGQMMINEVEADFARLLQGKSSPTRSTKLGDFLPSKQVSWLDRSYQQQDSPLWHAYLQRVEQEFADSEQKALSKLADSDYLGAATCQGCHAEAYKVWHNSKHAQAMKTLTIKKRAKNPSCVSCHSVAFGKGGFISMQHSPHFAGVQCENCHGPRKEHVLNPQQKTTKVTGNCTTCHHPPHTANFDRAHYWQQIKH